MQGHVVNRVTGCDQRLRGDQAAEESPGSHRARCCGEVIRPVGLQLQIPQQIPKCVLATHSSSSLPLIGGRFMGDRIESLEIQVGENLVLRGDRRGSPEHPPVILLHGGGQTRFSWKDTAEILAADGWQVITFDARGHGESDWAPAGEYGGELSAPVTGTRVRSRRLWCWSISRPSSRVREPDALRTSCGRGPTASSRWKRWPTRSLPTTRTAAG